MFVEDGVYCMGTRFREAWYKSVVWTLIDSDLSRNGVPEEVAHRDMRFFVIYVTSPVNKRWSRMDKSFSVAVVVMNPWTRNEIHRA